MADIGQQTDARFFMPCNSLITRCGKELDLDSNTGGHLGESNKFNAGAAGREM